MGVSLSCTVDMGCGQFKQAVPAKVASRAVESKATRSDALVQESHESFEIDPSEDDGEYFEIGGDRHREDIPALLVRCVARRASRSHPCVFCSEATSCHSFLSWGLFCTSQLRDPQACHPRLAESIAADVEALKVSVSRSFCQLSLTLGASSAPLTRQSHCISASKPFKRRRA